MEDVKNHLTKALLLTAIVSGAGAMVRFEVVASNVKTMKQEIAAQYTKREEFAVVKTDIRYIKEKQSRMADKVDKILEAVRNK